MASEVKNERYVMVGENVTYKELLSKLAILFGKKPPTKKLSKKVMFFSSGIDWMLNKLFGVKRKLVKATVRSMFTISLYDSSKIKESFKFQFTPIDKTLHRIVNESKNTLN